ncbi:hypothetical protein ABK040_015167 [Willaertia magna]
MSFLVSGQNITGEEKIDNIAAFADVNVFRDRGDFPSFPENVNIKLVSVGANFLMILLEDGSVYSMGTNESGQLSVTLSTTDYSTFTSKQVLKVNFFNNNPVKLLACGAHYTLFASENNELYGCGSNDYKQLDVTISDNHINTPRKINYQKTENDIISHLACCFSYSIMITNNSEVRLSGQNWVYSSTYSRSDVLVDSRHVFKRVFHTFTQSKVKKICSGGFHFVILLENGQCYGAGDSSSCQFGVQGGSRFGNQLEGMMEVPLKDKIQDIGCGGDNSVYLSYTGEVYVCGVNTRGEFPVEESRVLNIVKASFSMPIKTICMGEDYSIIVTANGDVTLRGKNDKGQLGSLAYEVEQNSFNLKELFKTKIDVQNVGIAAGYYHTVFYKKNTKGIESHFFSISKRVESEQLHDLLIKVYMKSYE